MENKKNCRHVVLEKCEHPELGGGVAGHRVWHCTICEYFEPKRKGAAVVKKVAKPAKGKTRPATRKPGKRRR